MARKLYPDHEPRFGSSLARIRVASALPLALALAAAAPGQTYRDLTFVRARPQASQDLLELEGGASWGRPESKDPPIGLDDNVGPDGHVYYKAEKFTGRETSLDAYFGRDGWYLGAVNGKLGGQGTETRLEISGRIWPFYREGFYRGSDFIPTGRYEGEDYGGAISFARPLEQGMRFEFGGFWRHYSLSRNDDTATNYAQPEDYDAYGVQGWLEQNTLKYSGHHGRPEGGFLATLGVQREWNDSNGVIGVGGGWQSTLPNGFWRGRGRVEWYTTSSESGTVLLKIEAALTDSKDRVQNYDAQKPIGHTYIDLDLGYRLDIGHTVFVTPAFKGQFIRILDELGTSSKSKTFAGFGLRGEIDFSTSTTLLADYSYLGNESRPPVSVTEDTFGEHQLYVAIRFRFGGG